MEIYQVQLSNHTIIGGIPKAAFKWGVSDMNLSEGFKSFMKSQCEEESFLP